MKHFLLYICLLFTSYLSNAQIGNDNQELTIKKEEKIKALYVAYITQQLTITPTEAEKFWPLHAQYDAELRTINNNNNELDRQQAMLNVKKKYASSFGKILGNERSNNFYKQDEAFRRKLMERLQKLRQNRKNNEGQGKGMGRRRQ